MAEAIIIPIQITIDTKGAEIGATRTTRSLNSIRQAAGRSTKSVRDQESAFFALQKATRFVDGPLGGVAARFETLNSVVSKSDRAMLGLVASIAAASITMTEFLRQGEKFQTMTNRLKLVTDSSAQLTSVQTQLFQVAQRSRTSLEATVDLYARFARSTKELKASQEQLMIVTEATSIATALSGTTAQSAAAALFQMSQGLAANRLSGQELNSVMEQTPRLAEAIAAGLREVTGDASITVGSLKKLGEQGKITSDLLLQSLITQLPTLREELARTAPTISQGVQALSNAWTQLIGNIVQSQGAISVIGKSLFLIADNLETILNLVIDVAALFAIKFAASLVATATTATTAAASVGGLSAAIAVLGRSIGLINPLTAALTVLGGAIYLVTTRSESLEEVAAKSAKTMDDVRQKIVEAANGTGTYAETLRDAAKAQYELNQQTIEGFKIQRSEDLRRATEDYQRTIRELENVSTQSGMLRRPESGLDAQILAGAQQRARELSGEIITLSKSVEGYDEQLARTFESYEKAVLAEQKLIQSHKDHTDELKKLRKEMDGLVEDMRTPQEEYTATMERIAELRRTVAKTPEDFEALSRAAKKAGKDLSEAFAKADPLTEVLQGTADDVESMFKNTFKDIFRDGELNFKSLADRIKDVFANMLAEMAVLAIARPIIVPIVQSAGGFMGASQPAISSVTGGIPGLGGGGFPSIGSFSGFGGIGGTIDAWGASNLGLGSGSFVGPMQGGAGLTGASLTGILGAGGLGAAFGSMNLFGGKQTGSTIGGGIGAAGGMLVGGPLGAMIGGALGSFVGGLFGAGEGVGASEFSGSTTANGFNIGAIGTKGAGPEAAQSIAGAVGNLVQALSLVPGMNLGGIGVSGGYNSRREGGGGFLNVAGRSFSFDPASESSVENVMKRLAVVLASVGSESENVTIAMKKISTSGRTMEEVLADIQFAAVFDQLTFSEEKTTQYEQALKDLNAQFDEVIETTKRLGLSEAQVEQARQDTLQSLRDDFNKGIYDQLLGFDNPLGLAIQQLDEAFDIMRKDANAIGGDLVALEELYGKQRADIVARSLQSQTSAAQSMLQDIQSIRDSLLLNEQLGGLNRQGRAAEAQSQYEDVVASVQAGEAGSFSQLSGAVSNYLTAALDYYGPTQEYFNRLQSVLSMLDSVEGSIPGFAGGTGGFSYSGLAVVGEKGPELVNFGAPAQVFSNGQSSAMFDGGSAEEIREYREQSAKETAYLGQQLEKVVSELADIKDEMAISRRSE